MQGLALLKISITIFDHPLPHAAKVSGLTAEISSTGRFWVGIVTEPDFCLLHLALAALDGNEKDISAVSPEASAGTACGGQGGLSSRAEKIIARFAQLMSATTRRVCL